MWSISVLLPFLLCSSLVYAGPCDYSPNKDLPFCDYKLAFTTRVKDLLSRLTLDEKLGLFVNGADSIPSFNISGYQWWSEALHGVGSSPGVHFTGNTPYATSFPQVIGLGATFDMDLVSQISDVISTEGRGMNHEGHAGLTYWAPNVNIFRDPRWGRGQETPGEDPYLTSQYAMHFVKGMQGSDEHYLKVSSCCKHYTAYDLENWDNVDRHHFNAIVTEQDLTDTFMPPFKSCVEGGNASSLMCSYNEVNGVPSCAHKDFMTEIARKQWGFQGYITGDCGAVDDVLNSHHYTTTTDETCKVTLEAGLDIDCGGFFSSHLPTAVKDGAVTEADIDAALTDLFLVQFRLGMFDPDSIQPYRKIDASNVNTLDNQALALKASLSSMVLLKNDGKTLPLDNSKLGKVALIGPNAQATTTMQGNYQGVAPYLISPFDGLGKYVNITYEKGCDINSNDQSGIAAACLAAQSADATILVIGLDQTQESEGHDRDSIDLPGMQNVLLIKIPSCSKGPVIVVVMAGGPLDLSVPKANPKVNSILWVGYPGQSGGDAIAQTIFGENSPAGRLPYTLYPKDFVNEVTMFDMNMRPGTSNPGRSYRFYTGTPIYGFGEGLSYTDFNISTTLSRSTLSRSSIHEIIINDQDPITSSWQSPLLTDVTVTVTNVGTRDSDVVLLGFMVPPDAGKDGNPIRYLIGFTRLHDLKVGQHETVVFPVTADDLSLVDTFGKRIAVPGTWTVEVGETKQHISVVS